MKEKEVARSIYLPEKIDAQVVELARLEDRSYSNMAMILIRRGLRYGE